MPVQWSDDMTICTVTPTDPVALADIKFKVTSSYKLLILKPNLKSTKGCPQPDGPPCIYLRIEARDSDDV